MIFNPKKQNIVFPKESSSVIYELVKKYNLEELQKQKIKQMSEADTYEQRKKIFNSLPGRLMADTVRNVAEEKISNEEMIDIFKKQLSLSQEQAKKLAGELRRKILIFAKEVPIEAEEEFSLTKMIKPAPKEPIKKPKTPKFSKTIKSSQKIPEKFKKEISEKKTKQKDIYREPIK